jgi:hypothetical protein
MRYPRLAPSPLQLEPQPLGIYQTELVCLVHRRLKSRRRHLGCEVNQSLNGCRHRDVMALGHVVPPQRVPPMCDESRLAVIDMGWRGHLNGGLPLAAKAPECGGALMTQHRLPSTTENGGRPLPLAGQIRSPDRIHPASDRVQPTLRDAVLDRAHRVSQLEELKERHDAMLSRGEAPDLAGGKAPQPAAEPLGIQVRHRVPKTPKPAWVPPASGLRGLPGYQWMPRVSVANRTCSFEASSAGAGSGSAVRSPRAARESGNSL